MSEKLKWDEKPQTNKNDTFDKKYVQKCAIKQPKLKYDIHCTCKALTIELL